MGFLLEHNDSMFWQRSIQVGRTTYLPNGREVFGADPQQAPDRHRSWIQTEGTDFATVPAISVLRWLAGVTTAARGSRSRGHRVEVALSRDASVASAPAAERPGVVESWDQFDRHGGVDTITGMVDLSEDFVVERAELELAPGHAIAAEYDPDPGPVMIPLPTEYETIELDTLLDRLGVPDLRPPVTRDADPDT